MYALCWILGILASFRTMPHEICGDDLLLRNSIFEGITIPIERIESVTPSRTARTGLSGLKVDADERAAVLGHADTTIRIGLIDVEVRGALVDFIDVTVDEPRAFVAAFADR
ncbi:hypothetical protein [Williamsia phyllosphaerae]|uniref:Uncharacterized protein n=1 Tax=Williamsia phyllosphaerae TaxID=885042 RepID=A0ABQ1UP25_9NOCA|nr:hypothetical protein [Williamsia phyllosphaerae]GGF23702.1 hypothetical protein GCM10007298_19540 [Williamsia phyllosphaerae]